ncbi:MAG: ribonuclease II, partial [Desulfovibrionales bacterium]
MHSLASTLEHVAPGCIVEYLHSGQPLLGWIVEAQPSRVRLININKREMKLPHSRLLPWPGPCCRPDASRQDMLDIMERHAERRETLAGQIQPLEIWELAQGELSQATADWFANLLWSDPDVDQIAAMGRALLRAKTHFKFSPPSFEVYPEETVQARLDMQEANRHAEMLVGHGTAFFKALWERYTKGGGKCLPELPKEVAAELRELLLTRISKPEDKESEKVWKQLRRGL